MKLLSSFSLGSLASFPAKISIKEITATSVKRMLRFGELDPSLGHPAMAEVLSHRFRIRLPWKRETLRFKRGDRAVVAQLFGAGRPPEGKVLTVAELGKLRIKFVMVLIK